MESHALSPQQRHILAWSRRGSVHDAHCEVLVEGPLHEPRLRTALAAVVRRHRLLSRPGEEPASRTELRALGPDRHLLVLGLPAVHADPGGLRNLVREIAAAYRRGEDGREEDDKVVQYDEFADWQNALADEDMGEGADALGGRLTRMRELARAQRLPFERPGGDAAASAWAFLSADLSPAETATLEDAAAGQSATPEEFALACWQTLLWRHCGVPEIAVGVVTDCRVYQELEPVIGPCAKALPVTTPIAGGDRFRDVLTRVRRGLGRAREELEFFNWPDDGPGASAHPVWGFAWGEAVRADAGEVTFAVREQRVWTGPFVLSLTCERRDDHLRLTLAYRPERVDDAMARCLLGQLTTLSAAAAAGPTTPVSALRAVSEAEARRLAAELNPAPGSSRPWRSAHRMFEERAAEAPGRVAVTAGSSSMTYGELDAAANRLAGRLRGLGAGPESLVGICLDRGIPMVTAMIAVHKAGAAYVPVDPRYPADHIRAVLHGARPSVLILDATAPAGLDGPWHTLPPDDDRDREGHDRRAGAAPGAEPPGRDAMPTNVDVDPRTLAYVLHTSGSTGTPKGVAVPHESFVNFLLAMRETPGMSPDDSLVAVTTLSFDIAELELWLPLTAGARVTVASRAEAADPAALVRLLERASATVMQATPVTWRMLLGAGWAGSPRLTALVGGEALPPELAAALRPRVRRLWNMYGPTETTIWSTCAEIEPDVGLPVSVGRPIAETCVHVLDADLRPVAPGMVGELCIGGLGVARGYTGRPGLTAERFVPDPYGCRPGGRMYRTGDLARYDPQGRLYVLGRADSQVKVRGFRIELGEVETALARHGEVRVAVATTVREPSGELRLDAHVVLADGAGVTPAGLRAFLAGIVPPAAVPSRIGVLGRLPLTANGKVDRAALPPIAVSTAPDGPRGAAAATGMERTVSRVWAAALGVERPGTAENFFDLGGHSVLLVEVSGRLGEELGREVSPLTIFEHPTIASLARHLEQDGTAAGTDGHAGNGHAGNGPTRTNGRDRLLRRRTRVEGQ